MGTLKHYLRQHPKKYLIFDFDETLFRLKLPWGIYHDKTMQILRNFDKDFYNRHQHKDWTNYELINAFVDEFGQEPRDQTLEYACHFETEFLEGYESNDKLVAWLKNQSMSRRQVDTKSQDQPNQKISLFVWTSNCSQTVTPILEENGLLDVLMTVVARDTVVYTKPNPEGFYQIIDELGLPNPPPNKIKEQFLMIGDSSSDQGAAQAAGIDFFRVEYFD